MTGKHYVFSARTTEEGLKTLNGLREKLNVNWDALVITAINGHYGVDVPLLPKATPSPEAVAKAAAKAEAKTQREAAAKVKAEEKATDKAAKEASRKAKTKVKKTTKSKVVKKAKPATMTVKQADGDTTPES